jgi:hypothetical protein
MTYEERMRAHYSKPSNADKILTRIVKGERSVDITGDEDIFYQVNKDRMTMAEFVNRDKFVEDAKSMKEYKKYLHDTDHGKTSSKSMRQLGQIPPEIYYARKELSDPQIPREERLKSIKKFLNDFPSFRTGDKRL